MTAELFTEKHARKGLQPAGLRNGTKLKKFQYVEAFIFPFIGVDTNNIQHQWKGSGRKNGTKNNMGTDLVVSLKHPDEITLYLAVTPNGNGYANKDLEKLKSKFHPEAPAHSIYEITINTKTGTGTATMLPANEYAKNK